MPRAAKMKHESARNVGHFLCQRKEGNDTYSSDQNSKSGYRIFLDFVHEGFCIIEIGKCDFNRFNYGLTF